MTAFLIKLVIRVVLMSNHSLWRLGRGWTTCFLYDGPFWNLCFLKWQLVCNVGIVQWIFFLSNSCSLPKFIFCLGVFVHFIFCLGVFVHYPSFACYIYIYIYMLWNNFFKLSTLPYSTVEYSATIIIQPHITVGLCNQMSSFEMGSYLTKSRSTYER